MKCPKCGVKLKVVQTEQWGKAMTVRRLRCRRCGLRLKSVEQLASQEAKEAPKHYI